jgi:hypothetical protein
MEKRKIAKLARHVGADGRQSDDGQEKDKAVRPKKGDDAQQREFHQDHDAPSLIDPPTARIRFQKDQPDTRKNGEAKRHVQPLRAHVVGVAPEQNADRHQVGGPKGDVPGAGVGQGTNRLRKENPL